MSARHFPNPFPDHVDGSMLLQENGMLIEPIKDSVVKIIQHLERMSESPDASRPDDISIYTGSTGAAYLHYLKYLRSGDRRTLDTARQMVENSVHTGLDGTVSFILGDTGVFALGAVICHAQGDKKRRDEFLGLIGWMESATDNTRVPDEVLYGRAGFLYGLLFVAHQIPDQDVIGPDIITRTVKRILESGVNTAKREQCSWPPLKYYWHKHEYVGAAHGYCGILHTLLLARNFLSQDELTNLVRPTIDYVLTLRHPSGNFQSSAGSSDDKLVHWCHGAPAAVHLFSLAYKVFDDEKYSKAALQCGEIVWERGLLQKGYGLCHGAAGNAYVFLRLYQLTYDQKYIHRAIKFAEWIGDYGKHGCRVADRPYSLFEGIAGTIYFLYDLLIPAKSAFPAYELPNI
ncbi:lanC-like protein 2 [Brevipalpus obovatus]|uniref:lanC-like protein 2 n=1 Tax=Brevipalpus obovatus TaxID=246614 RepID=UPI003D9E4516